MTGHLLNISNRSTQSVDLVDQLRADWLEEMPDLDTSAMGVAGRIQIISQKLQHRVAKALKPFDLKYSDFDVLATLRRRGPPFALTPTELMQSVVLSSGSIATLLKRLETRGFIVREGDVNDGRVCKAVLTQAGRQLVEKAVAVRFREARTAMSCLSQQQMQDLEENLRLLNFELADPD